LTKVPRVLVILPTYNERENLARALASLFEHNPQVEALVVDDSSPDGTGELATALAKSDPRIHVLTRPAKQGLGKAYLAGFGWGFERGYEFMVEMDADSSHRAQDLTAMLQAAKQADLVIGSRWVRGGAVQNWPLSRQMLSRGGNAYARIMLRSKIRDLTAGFRVFRAESLKTIDLTKVAAQGYSFQVEMAWRFERAGLRVVEVPITFVERINGASKMSSAIVREALWLITRWGLTGK
jgi:dolichol-phosphate mannosyltransferase